MGSLVLRDHTISGFNIARLLPTLPSYPTINTMHKTVLALLIFIFVTTSYLAVDVMFFQKEDPAVQAEEVLSIEDSVPAESAFGDLKEMIYYAPVEITINQDPVITVEEIGLATDGQLQVPSAWELAGWYKNSAKAGEKGNVIIDGHYDTDQSTPAAFWGLKNINVNDTVTLQDELRRDFSYKVVDSFYVDISDPQRTKVFEETGDHELTLVTCGGVWDPSVGTYNKRLVIKAKLIES